MISVNYDYEIRSLIFKNKIIQNRCFQMGVTLLKSPVGKPGFSLMQGKAGEIESHDLSLSLV